MESLILLVVEFQKTFIEDERDILSQIIQRINEIYGDHITDEDKIDLENMKKRVSTNEELKEVLTSDNSETNKRHKFDEVMTSILLSYVNNRLDFYNKMEDPKIKNFISDLLYQDLEHKFNPQDYDFKKKTKKVIPKRELSRKK